MIGIDVAAPVPREVWKLPYQSHRNYCYRKPSPPYSNAFPTFSSLLSLGWWATQSYTQLHKNHDPSEVIIDEVAGQWIALLPLAVGATHAGASLFALWPGWVAAFLLFRLFDIWKPSIIGWADRRSDAIGVMLDDCFAGLFAALSVIALAGLFNGLLS